jgi:penicillin-binding protein 1A
MMTVPPGPIDAWRVEPRGQSFKATVGWRGIAFAAVAIAAIPFYLALTASLRGLSRLETSTHQAIKVVALGILCAVSGLVVVIYAALFGGSFPSLQALTGDPLPTIGRIEDARGEALAEMAVEYRRPTDTADKLPGVLQEALLAAEDKSFFEHPGVDFSALPRIVAKAAVASWHAHRLALPQGGSTLTMQLVRMAFLREWTAGEGGPKTIRDTWIDRLAAAVVGVSATNKLHRKVEEIRLALWLERELQDRLGSRKLAKEEILRRYAAYVYLGDGRYGFSAAAEHYFGRPLASFDGKDASSAALLAGIPKWPGRYAPSEANLGACLRRRNHVLELMAQRGYLNEEQRVQSSAQPVRLPVAADDVAARSSAVHSVLDAMTGTGDGRVSSMALFEGRIRVRSSVDRRIQELLISSLEDGLKTYETRHPGRRGVVQGSAVVLANSDARILAVVGGRQLFKDRPGRSSDLNRATESRRQPGSTMKPLVYVAAFRHGDGLDTQVLDAPVAIAMGGGRPPKWINNYDGTFRGLIPLRVALAESRNAPTVRLVTAVGIGEVVRAAHDLGIRSQLQPYVTTGLGASEVTLLELANAYRAMASEVHATPWILERVATSDGLELYRHSDATLRPIHDPALALIQEALRGVVRLPGATAHSLASLPEAVMGKTGTTSGFRDALFVGSTFGKGGVTIAVRVGFDDNRSLGDGETGGRVALPIFRVFVERAYERGLLGPAPLFPPAIERDIDAHLRPIAPAPPEPEISTVASTAPAPDAMDPPVTRLARATSDELDGSEAIASR